MYSLMTGSAKADLIDVLKKADEIGADVTLITQMIWGWFDENFLHYVDAEFVILQLKELETTGRCPEYTEEDFKKIYDQLCDDEHAN